MSWETQNRDADYQILVVDDEESMRSLITHYLEQQTDGFEVETAANGHAALDILRDDDYEIDAVLLDISMPKMDGFETLKRIQEESHDVVVIMLSGRVGEEEELHAFDLGALDYVTKPFSLEVLTARLKLNLAREAELRSRDQEASEAGPGSGG